MITRITNATVLDLTTDTAELVPDQQVVIENGTIQSVQESDRINDRDVIKIDAAGRVLMPGLIDGHVHVTAFEANLGAMEDQPASYRTIRSMELMQAMLSRGFTTVRDVGGADFGLARAVAEGRIAAPRLIFGGKALSQSGGHGDGRPPGRSHLDDCCGSLGTVADGVDEVLRKARNEIRRGAHHIKIMLGGGVASPTDRISDLQFSTEEIQAAVLAATNAGKYVAGHAYTTAAVRQGLQNGVRSIEHGNLMDESVFGLFTERDAYYVPTLVAYDAMSRAGASIGLSPDNLLKNAVVIERGLATLEAADRAGLKIVFGTDLLGVLQSQQSREFLIRKQVQSSEAIIRSATTVAAELIGMVGEVGVVAPGAAADLLIIDGDPLDNVGVLADPNKNIRALISNGALQRCDLEVS
jgi:imidazolonepropionase-like amidohydrolase